MGRSPPSQERVTAVVERAARALAAQLTAEEWGPVGTILLTLPVGGPALDLSCAGCTAFSPNGARGLLLQSDVPDILCRRDIKTGKNR